MTWIWRRRTTPEPSSILLPAEEVGLDSVMDLMRAQMKRLETRIESLSKEAPARPSEPALSAVQADLEALRREIRQEGRTRLKQTAATEGALELLRETVAGQAQLAQTAATLSQTVQQRASESWLGELFSALDALDSGIGQLRAARLNGLEGFAAGFEMARGRLLGLLHRHDVEPMPDGLGRPLDPSTQRAIGTRIESDVSPGVVVELARRGYRGQGRILRYAEVVVASAERNLAVQGEPNS